jgi:outer membrane protein TolC
VEIEARSALLDLASAREGVLVAAERLALAEQELRQSEERFRAGAAGSVETSQAQLGLFAARDASIQSKVNLGSAKVRAYRALGALDQLK